MSCLLFCGCTLADGFNFTFGDGGESGSDLGRPLEGGTTPMDAALPDAVMSSGRCGAAYERCCTSGAPCKGGGCCDGTGQCVPSGGDLLLGGGQGGGVCLDGTPTACGDSGAPCCGRNTCHASGCCVDGSCIAVDQSCGSAMTGQSRGLCEAASCLTTNVGDVPCGGVGEACCSDGNDNSSYCVASGLACNPDTSLCEPCGDGTTGELCCEGNLCTGAACCVHDGPNPTCLAVGQVCGNTTGSCANAGCQACGREGEPCCADNVGCTAPFTACHNSMCAPCGGKNQPCCEGAHGGFCVEPYSCKSGNCN